LEIENQAMIEDLFTLLEIPDDLPNVIVCNHRVARKEDILQNGAVVAIFPPLAGG
jgi:molybdopterin converting factor small subunit